MKLLHLNNMYKKISYITALMVVLASITVEAQITTQSPYSKFGVGNIKGMLLPQLKAMGGISTGVYKPYDFYNNTINMQNPASYAGIGLTTIDIGLSTNLVTLKSGSIKENNFNATLSHFAIGIPVNSHSAMSFGILPYSETGYQFTNRLDLGNGQQADYIYAGEGGLTKAYIGYGYRIGHLNLGANAEYTFGNLLRSRSTELVVDPTVANNTINSRMQDKNSVGGINFSYGLQYDIALNSKTSIIIGYSGSSASKLSSTTSNVVTQYRKDGTTELTAIDTLPGSAAVEGKLKLPLMHNFGFTVQKMNKWMFGADYRIGKWSEYSVHGVNQGLQDTYGVSVGGQITPDFNSIGNYFDRVDYRLGVKYDKTYINLQNQDIKQMAITFGLGLPLARNINNQAFYRMNFSTEIGKRGTTNNGLLQENFINFHLGFTLNDRWFRKFKFD
ncbi:porin family protein [Pedobacter nutrimenti]|uniref:Long-subunit fatty acid transport protein n=1 Tax=Pedobacter nutrimenti TaxID=1241337 RepID=A0A318UV68_9SPHI|nr:hypothetical protein [Pedobacter nutrimenti]PYF75509.1 hypothetical protein B0O44_10258 [Pedobacter nutrimenti]